MTRKDLPLKSSDVFIQRQTRSGGAPYISATTNFNSATYFASTKNGEIYVLRLKSSDVILAPIRVSTGFEECEYLIPDFVDMSEIVAKFDYKDYVGIKDYLTETIRLEIKDEDLLPEISSENNFVIEELLKMGVTLPDNLVSPIESPKRFR